MKGMPTRRHYSVTQRGILVLLAFSSVLLSGVVHSQNDTSFCGCPECTVDVWNRLADGNSCGARITYVTDVLRRSPADACQLVAATEYQDICGPCHCPNAEQPQQQEQPQAQIQEQFHCGCAECTDTVWNTQAKGYSCGDRINYLLQSGSQRYTTEDIACRRVANVEYPGQCGACACGGTSTNIFADDNSNVLAANGYVDVDDDNVNHTPLTPESDLYCYPPYGQRQRYQNVWGNYTVEVKEGAVCGPSGNRFTTNTVSLQNDRLTLQYKMLDSAWESSEVRVVSSDQDGFDYGVYELHVQSIQVLDSRNGQVVDTILPPSLTLGFFSWDDTEDYATNENFNHEVDVEISRWNNASNADVQFLVQPPDTEHTYRFFSGNSDGVYQQAPQSYGFDWRPAEIEWFFKSADGGGQHYVYSSQIALEHNLTNDYLQCMPADVEIRLNLWNFLGGGTPPGMEDYHVVEVVIDSFEYTPNGLKYVPDGGTCSKNCHCSRASRCWDNVCQPLPLDATTIVFDLNSNNTDNADNETAMTFSNSLQQDETPSSTSTMEPTGASTSTSTSSITMEATSSTTAVGTTMASPTTIDVVPKAQQLIGNNGDEVATTSMERRGPEQGYMVPLAISMVILGILIGMAAARYLRSRRTSRGSFVEVHKGSDDQKEEVETIVTSWSSSFSNSFGSIMLVPASSANFRRDGACEGVPEEEP